MYISENKITKTSNFYKDLGAGDFDFRRTSLYLQRKYAIAISSLETFSVQSVSDLIKILSEYFINGHKHYLYKYTLLDNDEALKLEYGLFLDFASRFRTYFSLDIVYDNSPFTSCSYNEVGVNQNDFVDFVASLERVCNFYIPIPEKSETLHDLFSVFFNKYRNYHKLIVEEGKGIED